MLKKFYNFFAITSDTKQRMHIIGYSVRFHRFVKCVTTLFYEMLM